MKKIISGIVALAFLVANSRAAEVTVKSPDDKVSHYRH